jgi:hypothetical protein
MDPSFWGKAAWQYFHTLTFNYPTNPTKEDKLKYFNHFKSLGDMLPCPSCAESYKIYFKYIPITDYLNDIHGVTFWLYIIHYVVNKKLGKDTPSFLSVIKTYYPKKASCPTTNIINLNEKCTAKPQPDNSNNSLFIQFKNDAEKKYLNKILKQLNKLFTENPNK